MYQHTDQGEAPARPQGAPAISVVVPTFDVAEYIGNCMRSLLEQRFEEYEVVCVDDGSTDGTGALLDDSAASDLRVRVLHTENTGLSEARNAGVRAARGALVSFVDGDDVVSPHYLAMLHGAHGGAPGRMVIGRARRMRRDNVGTVEWPQGPGGKKVLSRDEAIRAYLLGEIGFVAWGRLAPRDLYLNEPFEPGAIYEDSIALPSHLSATDEVVVLDAQVYGYVAREGSLTDPWAMSLAHVRGRVRTREHLCEVALTWQRCSGAFPYGGSTVTSWDS